MKKSFFLFPLACLLLGSCSESDTPKFKEYQPIAMTRSEEQIADAQEKFADKLIQAVATEQNNQNWVISPINEFISLSMLANAVSDEKFAEFKKGLCFPEDADITDINRFNKRIMSELRNADNRVEMEINNANWVDNRVTLLDGFNDIATEYYNAPVVSADLWESSFNNPNHPVNLWYSNVSDGMIKYTPKFDKTFSISASALNFRGTWTKEFDKKDTKSDEFKNYDKSFSRIDLMYADMGKMDVYYNDDFEMISLPYGNTAFSMEIYLPENNLDEFLKTFSRDCAKNKVTPEVKVYLPKFELTSKIDGLEAVESLGINFSNLSKGNPFPKFYTTPADTDVLVDHSSTVYISVDEEGTEVKQVVDYDSGVNLSPGHDYHTFRVDRPFFFTIVERSTGSVITAGAVYKL